MNFHRPEPLLQQYQNKKGRTFLTSFASSIGIIGIAVILSLSSGFRTTIDDFQRDAMAQFPVLITQNTAEMDLEQMRKEMGQRQNLDDDGYADSQEVYLKDPSSTIKQHTNVFSEEYLNYLSQIDPSVCSSVGLTRIVNMNLLRGDGGGRCPRHVSSSSGGSESGGNAMMSGWKVWGFPLSPGSFRRKIPIWNKIMSFWPENIRFPRRYGAGGRQGQYPGSNYPQKSGLSY